VNARQARRIIMWMNGQYLIAADHYGLSDDEVDTLSEQDLTRLGKAQHELGEELLRRSGMGRDIPLDMIVQTVLDEPEGRGSDDS
jgi:hypothetical protein